MKKAELICYEIEFNVTDGEEITTPITKRTAKQVVELIKNKMNKNEYRNLHDLGYTEEKYNKWKNTLEKMLKVAQSYC